MADIRDGSTSAGWNTPGAGAYSPLEVARATSGMRMSDQIAVEKRGLELANAQAQEAAALNVPEWVLVARKDVHDKPGIKLSVAPHGMWYRDALGCKVSLPSSARAGHAKDGMLLSDFVGVL